MVHKEIVPLDLQVAWFFVMLESVIFDFHEPWWALRRSPFISNPYPIRIPFISTHIYLGRMLGAEGVLTGL